LFHANDPLSLSFQVPRRALFIIAHLSFHGIMRALYACAAYLPSTPDLRRPYEFPAETIFQSRIHRVEEDELESIFQILKSGRDESSSSEY
jgi:hypothetical protein